MGGFSIGRLWMEVGGDTSRLNEALKQAMDAAEKAGVKLTQAGQKVAAGFDATLNPTKQLGEQLKLLELTGRTTGEVLAVMGDKIKAATDAATKNGQPISEIVQKYANLGKEGSKTGATLESLGTKLTELARSPLSAAKSGATELLATLGPMAVGLGAVATAAITAGGGIAKFAIDAGQAAERIQNLSLVTGLSVEKVQALERLSKESGVGDLFDSLQRINKELGRPEGGEFTKGLLRIGIDPGQIADGTDAIAKLKDQLDQIPDRTEAARVANAALGKGYEGLRAIVLNTSLDFRKLLSELEKDPMFRTGAAQDAAASLDDEVDKLSRTFVRMKTEGEDAAVVLAGPVLKSINSLIPWAEALSKALHPPVQALSKLLPFVELAGRGLNLVPFSNSAKPGELSRFALTPAEQAVEDMANRRPGEDLEAKRRDAIAEAEARASGVRKDLVAVTIELHKAEERLNAEKAKAAGGQYNEQALRSAADQVTMIKARRDAIESAHKAELAAIENLKKPLDEHYELRKRIYDLEAELATAVERNDLARAKRLASEIGQLSTQIKLEEQLKNIHKSTMDVADKLFPENDPAKTESERIKNTIKQMGKDLSDSLGTYGEIQKAIDKETTTSALEKLRIEEKIVATITPLSDIERKRIELEKVHLKYAIEAEEVRVKWTQKRADLMEKISKLDPTDPLRVQALKDLDKLTSKMNDELKDLGSLESAEVLRVHREEYAKMIDSVRDGAGKIFDAIVSRGKGAFQSLSDWLEGAFLTRLRTVFENLMESIFTPSSGGSWFDKLFKGVFPKSASSTGSLATPPFMPSWSASGTTVGGVYYPSITGTGAGGKAGGFGGLLGGLGGSFLGVAGLGGLTGALMGKGSGGKLLWGGLGGTLGGLGFGLSSGAFAAGGSGALLGLGAGGGLLGLGIAGGVIGTQALIKAIRGKNAWTAGGMESSRDFGVNISGKSFQQWAEGLGLNESKTYPIRKDLQSSPLFLTQVAAPEARKQGTFDSFLKSLEQVKTSWGSFNFRDAFEIGDLTGDWSDLDEAFKSAFASSTALQKSMPDWQEKLTLSGDAAKQAAIDFEKLFKEWESSGEVTDELLDFLDQNNTLLDSAAMKSSTLAEQLERVRAAVEKWKDLAPVWNGLKTLKSALESSTEAAKGMYQTFFETGEITDKFRAKIVELGGDVARFEEGSRLAKLLTEFDDLAESFRQTGVVTERLREIFREFGGDLAVLDDAARMEGLLDGLANVDDFISAFERLLDVVSPLQKILQGEWGADMWGGLEDLGLDPSKFTHITDLIKMTKDWDQAVSDFNRTGKLVRGGVLEQALYQFGGAAGTTAIERYRSGFNTITPGLLDQTKAALDKAYKDELKTSLGYLRDIEKKTNDEISALNDTVDKQLELVRTNVVDALDKSRTEIVAELNLMLDKLSEIATNTAPAAAPVITPPAPTTTTDTGDGGAGDTIGGFPGREEYSFASTAPSYMVNVTVTGDNYGIDSLARRLTNVVEDALTDIRRRGGPAYSRP